MGKYYDPLTDAQIKALPVAKVREECKKMSAYMNDIYGGKYYFCHSCNDFHSVGSFYNDKRFQSGLYPECKKSLFAQALDYDKKTDTYVDNREKTIEVFRKLDIPFYDSLYKTCVADVAAALNERNKTNAFQHMIAQVKSLPQYKRLTFKDSVFESDFDPNIEEVKVNQKTLKDAKKRFGAGYSIDEYAFLENEYQDWITRYECNTKAQEEIFKNLSSNRLERKQAVKDGKPTKEIDKTFQELLAAQNIQPRQAGVDTLSDAQTFGTLIQKYEETRPCPDIDPELEDVDKIGLYFEVFFRGHLARVFNIKNAFSHIYEKFMKKFTVNKPQYDEEEDSEAIFDKIFSSAVDKE